jgi:flagellin
MGFRINTNVDAFDAQRNLGVTAMEFSKSIEKLSSGLRINRAGDDAAGLSISEKLRAQVRGLAQAVRNSQDGISMVQTGEGALNEVQAILQRMRELGVQGSSGTLSADDRTAIVSELKQLRDEIKRIASVTDFNGTKLLAGASATAATTGSAGAVSSTYTSVDTLTVTANSAVNTLVGATYQVKIASVSGTGTSARITGIQVSTDGGSTWGDMLSVSGSTALNVGNGLNISFNATGTANSVGATYQFTTTAGSAASATQVNVSLQIGASTSVNERLTVSFSTVNANLIGDGTQQNALSSANQYAVKDIDDAVAQLATVAGQTGGQAAFRALVDSAAQALNDVSGIRSTLGANQNRLEHTIANLGVAQENLTASESRIRDVDMASEMVHYTKTQILQQAGTAILAQANQAPNAVLSLLR